MEGFFSVINDGLVAIDDFIWGVPLMVLILFGGILLTVRLRAVQFRQLPRALRYMVKNEKGGAGEVSSFGALCTALSATIGTGNIVGVPRPSSPAARARCSGCGWPRCSAWPRSSPRDCWP